MPTLGRKIRMRALGLAGAAAFALVGVANVDTGMAAVHEARSLAATRDAPRVVPRNLRSKGLKRRRVQTTRKARASFFDSSYSVDSLAYCASAGGLPQFTPGGGISTGPAEYTASSSNPYAVRPSIGGNQWIAFNLVIQRSNGAVGESGWYWGYALHPEGLFQQFYDSGSWRFQNVKTGQRLQSVTAWDKPPSGLGDRFIMHVAWYVGNTLVKTKSVYVPWTNGQPGSLYCMQP
jgi:hypothetical protein